MSAARKETRVFRLLNVDGLHARPASLFARAANRYRSEITVEKDGNVVDGKSIMGLLILGAEAGSSLKVTARGEDAAEVLDELERLFKSNFGEE
jgi:phosphocarrier protein